MHKILPVFIPFYGCKSRCIYCNQTIITGVDSMELLSTVKLQLERWFATDTTWSEIAFYGGTFGNLPTDTRHQLYELATGYGIRYSTCPDSVTNELIAEMQKYNVTTVEIGVQSLSDNVLAINGRNYNAKDVVECFATIPHGIKSVAQLMTGMYNEQIDDILLTGHILPQLKADHVRIYPTLVFKNTKLAQYYLESTFTPLSREDTLLRAAWLYICAQSCRSSVIRIGLPETDAESIAAGWWHPAMGELVKTMVLDSYIRAYGTAKLPAHSSVYGYKSLIRHKYNINIEIKPCNISKAMIYISKKVMEHYSEGKQWFAERKNIEFAADLGSASDIR